MAFMRWLVVVLTSPIIMTTIKANRIGSCFMMVQPKRNLSFEIDGHWGITSVYHQSPRSSLVAFVSTTNRLYSTLLYTPRRSFLDYPTRLFSTSSSSTSWKGRVAPFSEFASHVEVDTECLPTSVANAVRDAFDLPDDDGENKRSYMETIAISPDFSKKKYTPRQLLHLGAVWYMPAKQYQENNDKVRQYEIIEINENEQENNSLRRDTESPSNRNETSKSYEPDQHNFNLHKPTRLTLADASMTLEAGDYLRVHYDPRRFPNVYDYDWSIPTKDYLASSLSSHTSTEKTDKDGDSFRSSLHDDLLVQEQRQPTVVLPMDDEKFSSFLVIDKPSGVPVHSTVDNAVENVLHQISMTTAAGDKDKTSHLQPDITDYELYPTHRLDTVTSGLLVVGRSKTFTAYFAELLRKKTAQQQIHFPNKKQMVAPQSSDSKKYNTPEATAVTNNPLIRKGYKCLVCVLNPSQASSESTTQLNNTMSVSPTSSLLQRTIIQEKIKELRDLAAQSIVVRHFTKRSVRAPKRFEVNIPNSERTTALQQGDFEGENKNNTDNIEDWLECDLQITDVGEIYWLEEGKESSSSSTKACHEQVLKNSLWSFTGVPTDLVAVLELQIQLVTGRTHQIRGQLSCMGFPIVGDLLYGGSVVTGTTDRSDGSSGSNSIDESVHQRLALQCCELDFVDPDYVTASTKKKKRNKKKYESKLRKRQARGLSPPLEPPPQKTGEEVLKGVPSSRWNSFRLKAAWWTPYLKRFRDRRGAEMKSPDANETSSTASNNTNEKYAPDQQLEDGHRDIRKQNTENRQSRCVADQSSPSPCRPDLLPPRVQLTPGRQKYVLVKALSSTAEINDTPVAEYWFVKSASAKECGGPYHADVAEDLVEWIKAAGFENVEVSGGGRIDYTPETAVVKVYGFSYQYGKGDHTLAASMIEDYFENSDVSTTPLRVLVDHSSSLY